MDFLPTLFGDGDKFEMFCKLMDRYMQELRYVIYRTRDYKNGLVMADELNMMNDVFFAEGKLDAERNHAYHCAIASYRLDMLDNADEWERYVEYHDELRTTRNTETWAYEPEHETDFAEYLIEHDGLNSTMHWLCRHHKQREKVKRKLERGGRRHRPQSEWTEEELREKFNVAMKHIALWNR